MAKAKQTAAHLRLVDAKGEPMQAVAESETDAPGGPGYQPQPKHDASTVIGNAVMYAAMSWVACCLEETAEAVEVTPIGPGIFNAVVHFGEHEEMWLRVLLALQGGATPRLSTTVEPLHT